MTTEQVIEKLRHPGNKVPQKEFEEVVRRRDEFVPLLIEEIKRATELGSEAPVDDLGSSFALYLLAQLREPQALEPIMEYFALDSDEDDLFGDMITQNGGQVLAAVGHKNPEALEAYVKREGISRWVRSATFLALALQVVCGDRPREEVVRFFRHLVQTNAFGDNDEAWTDLVYACTVLDPRDLLDEIEQLYQRDLVDYTLFGNFERIQKDANQDPAQYLARKKKQHPPITDAADEVRWWQMFSEPEPAPRKKPLGSDAGVGMPRIISDDGTPVRKSSTDTVGRNDLCPCGSGKKYKKCCMPRG